MTNYTNGYSLYTEEVTPIERIPTREDSKRIAMIQACHKKHVRLRKQADRTHYLYIKPAIIAGLIGDVKPVKLSADELTFALTSSHDSFMKHVNDIPHIISGHDAGEYLRSVDVVVTLD
jgi:hypothetical protein